MSEGRLNPSHLISDAGEGYAEIARRGADRWLTEFRELMDIPSLSEPRARAWLRRFDDFAQEGDSLARHLASEAAASNTGAAFILQQAVEELPTLRSELRRSLGEVDTADPSSPALVEIRERLAERQARRDLGVATGAVVTAETLELPIREGSWWAALPMLLFGGGWISFTAFHALLMIRGMWQFAGPAALLLCGFYAIFFGVGFAMIGSAIRALASETFELQGSELTISRKYPWGVSKRVHALEPSKAAYVATPNFRQKGSTAHDLVLTAEDGKTVRIGGGDFQQTERLAERINRHLNSIIRS